MKFQYVFGNPTGGKKKRSKKVAKKVKRKNNPRKTKLVAYEPVKIKNLNTGKITKKKGKVVAKYSTKEFANKADLAKMKVSLAKARQAIAEAQIHKKKIKGKAAKSAAGKVIAAAQKTLRELTAKYKAKVKLASSEIGALNGMIKNMKELGAIVKTETTYSTKGSSVAKKKKRRKKKSTRKKASRKKSKKASGKKKKSTKKKTKKRKSSKKRRKAKKSVTVVATKKVRRKKRKSKSRKKKYAVKTSAKKTKRKSSKKRRSSKRRRPVKLKKGQSVLVKANPKKKSTRRSRRRKNPSFGGIIMKKNNPMSVAGMKVAGYDPMELAELAAGGLFYGAANSYISPIFAKIPGLGSMANLLGGTVPSLVAGIAANIVSDKVGNKQVKTALEFIGDGLLGAAVVGLGVHLSQTLLPASMSGVSYVPAAPGIDPDFNGLRGVDYTPDGGYMSGMGAVDFIPGMSLPGQNPAADFGKWAYEQDAADFGEVPEGLHGFN